MTSPVTDADLVAELRSLVGYLVSHDRAYSADVVLRAAKALEAAARLREPVCDGWRPIETAPKDGTSILAFDPDGINDPTRAIVQWYEPGDYGFYQPHPTIPNAYLRVMEKQEGYWQGGEYSPFRATHWMPLPAPPTPKDEP